MKYPIFASFIILTLVIRHAIRRNRRIDEKAGKSFWDIERAANEVRRKPLDDLIFVIPDMSRFPLSVMEDDEIVSDCRRMVEELSSQKIVNLTGQTNTDLKFRYGVANLPQLMEYDERFTLLVQNLQKWADRLWDNGFINESVPILEEEIRLHADISSAYRKLATYYRDKGMPEKIDELKKSAESLNSVSKASILRYLEQA
ncbi:MAG: hypothetical protein ILP17_00460 [Lachnospiraceae bacterium]|nr:hypothetical protein [Lachnospiraceae bacterium]MBP1584150.1 hypothetical protein [Lachnospiraceae bacterium]